MTCDRAPSRPFTCKVIFELAGECSCPAKLCVAAQWSSHPPLQGTGGSFVVPAAATAAAAAVLQLSVRGCMLEAGHSVPLRWLFGLSTAAVPLALAP